jgi:hypothetical protein
MEALILAIALNSNVDPSLLKAICMQETKLHNITIKNDGKSTSYGPCQVKQIAARQISSINTDLTKAENSIKVAAEYLKHGIKKCGSIDSGVGFYNVGKCLKSFKKDGYLSHVMVYYKQFKEESMWYNVLYW